MTAGFGPKISTPDDGMFSALGGTDMKGLALAAGAGVLMMAGVGIDSYLRPRSAEQAQAGGQAGQTAGGAALSPQALDALLAPIALYPDQLLAQILLCAGDPAGVTALDKFLKSQPNLKGTELQDAAVRDNFEPQFVAMSLFPQIISSMAMRLQDTTRLGQAFAADKSGVFASIQRLRKQAQAVGNLKTTPQQAVETRTTSAGEQVVVIEPANPQVIYVPQYNTETVYVQSAPAPTTQTIVIQEDDDDDVDAAVAGMIGFTAGVAMGAWSSPYYYGPYGMYGGAYMYNDAWDDYYDHREDAREDWMDHREDVMEDRGERREDVSENRGERSGTAQEQRTERQQNRQANGTQATQAQRDQARANAQSRAQGAQGASTQSATTHRTRGSGSYESRGSSQGQARTTTQQRSGTGSGAFSGYASGSSTRSASSRGSMSRSSGGGRSRGGGGRRR
jgi:hypothetical protein